MHTVAVIGAGKIGEVLLSGLLRSGWAVDRLLATARGSPSRMPASVIASTRK